ncbi:TetR/AcrR family transcriptional regulator [Terrabacter terrigena]|uniref:TetR/AcrR family transcriptional regulator n=1 Tax=Terrabacter terrigena TaxID=574718 RepID=A0ABW3MWE1_9MICO
MRQRTGRAAPMHPDDRREALIGVFLDLAHREGRPPTTSEIAREAGVAEGTIFRVFATKDALQDEAVQTAFCPAPVRRSIAAIGTDLPVRDRLVAFTTIMQRRFTEVFGLMAALGLTEPPDRGPHLACYAVGRHLRGATDEGAEDCGPHQPLLDTIHQLVLSESDTFVVPARDVVHRIRLLCFSGSHPGIADGMTLTPEEIVDTVLYGVIARPTTSTHGTGLGIAELYAELGGDSATLVGEEQQRAKTVDPHPA